MISNDDVNFNKYKALGDDENNNNDTDNDDDQKNKPCKLKGVSFSLLNKIFVVVLNNRIFCC